jgi:hypothetical protein
VEVGVAVGPGSVAVGPEGGTVARGVAAVVGSWVGAIAGGGTIDGGGTMDVGPQAATMRPNTAAAAPTDRAINQE